jgi:hypothetical protein
VNSSIEITVPAVAEAVSTGTKLRVESPLAVTLLVRAAAEIND